LTAAGTPGPDGLDLASIRKDYDVGTLDAADLPAEPLVAVRGWLAEAVAAGVLEPTAMVVSTATPDGAPSSRTVLLKGVDDRGLTFFTNRGSRKGRQLAANPRCAALLRWDALHRQVGVTGTAELVDDAESDAYFASRPRGSQVGAWASRQSEVIADRGVLERWAAEVEERFPGEVPRPPFWGGYRIVPDSVELWQGRPSRLHDRLRYRRGEDGAWILERLSP
jgi:pyridoxamine 5'-phosphate oxidase